MIKCLYFAPCGDVFKNKRFFMKYLVEFSALLVKKIMFEYNILYYSYENN